jgi:cell division protein FtsB
LSRADIPPKSTLANGTLGRGARLVYRLRRRLATGLVIAAALFFGYRGFFGENGVNMYEQKRVEGRAIEKKIAGLQQDNGRLQQHIQQLKNDPDAIEHEARERLHYARPGEVIWTENDAQSTPAAQPEKK